MEPGPQRAPAIWRQSPDPGEVGAPAGWSPAPPTARGLTGPTGGHPRHRASPVSNRGHGSRKWSPKLCSTEHPGHCSERLLDRRTLGALSGLRHSHWVHGARVQWARATELLCQATFSPHVSPSPAPASQGHGDTLCFRVAGRLLRPSGTLRGQTPSTVWSPPVL